MLLLCLWNFMSLELYFIFIITNTFLALFSNTPFCQKVLPYSIQELNLLPVMKCDGLIGQNVRKLLKQFKPACNINRSHILDSVASQLLYLVPSLHIYCLL